MTNVELKQPRKWRIYNRRKHADMRVVWMRSAGVIGWLLLVAVLGVYEQARPEFNIIDARLIQSLGLELDLRRSWDFDLARYMFYLMGLGAMLSMSGLLLSIQRNRRNDDGYRFYLSLLGLISLTGMLVYFFNFT